MPNEIVEKIQPPNVYVPDDLFSSIQALEGAKIESVATIPAEVSRQVKEYVLLKVRKGRGSFRLILVAAEVVRPCPSGNDLWDLMETFFTPDEIKARYANQAWELPKMPKDNE